MNIQGLVAFIGIHLDIFILVFIKAQNFNSLDTVVQITLS